MDMENFANPDNFVRVSATTHDMSVDEIRKALEAYVGEPLELCKWSWGLKGMSENDKSGGRCIATASHSYEFFYNHNIDGSLTLYDEDDRFASYEECVSVDTRGCAIVERLANDIGGFDVYIECFGACSISKIASRRVNSYEVMYSVPGALEVEPRKTNKQRRDTLFTGKYVEDVGYMFHSIPVVEIPEPKPCGSEKSMRERIRRLFSKSQDSQAEANQMDDEIER